MMRVLALIALVSAMALLAACSSGPRQVGATAPTVTYSYRNDAELRDARDNASDWCADRYDAVARPVDRWPANGEATFACVPD
jgi:uncharacterized lipoprotein